MYAYLVLLLSFVDRDTLMRFLGYGIGHKKQTKSTASSNRFDNKGKGTNQSKAQKSHKAARRDHHQDKPPRCKVLGPEVMDDVQDDEDINLDSSDDGSDADLDDLDGSF